MVILNSELDRIRKELPDLPRGISDAASDVLIERLRQVRVEGWTVEHDDEHAAGELARAAACYAYAAFQDAASDSKPSLPVPMMWPWAPEYWKPRPVRRALVKAAALIVAEIERLDRAESK